MSFVRGAFDVAAHARERYPRARTSALGTVARHVRQYAGVAKDRGNYIAEWFGHRVYPDVADTPAAREDRRSQRCPFLSVALGKATQCVKPVRSVGVCTISSVSNGLRQDWLVCPYRALDDDLMDGIVQRLFGGQYNFHTVFPAVSLTPDRRLVEFADAVHGHGGAIVLFQDKLGGEIGLSPTERSPELSFDVTLVEVTGKDGVVKIGRYGLVEIQTMDFHGSYAHAVRKLEAALDLHADDFGAEVAAHPEWPGEKIEGPNIGNVFKRTFYQMVFKFQAGTSPASTGVALAIPRAVWDSWQRYLGRPDLVDGADGSWHIKERDDAPAPEKTWIYVFDVEPSTTTSPNRLVPWRVIRTSPETLTRNALELAPSAAFQDAEGQDVLQKRIRMKVATLLVATELRFGTSDDG